MKKPNLFCYSPKVRKFNKAKITKYLMKNMFCNHGDLTNESSVEQFFMIRLIKSLGYNDKDIKTKEAIQKLFVGKGSRKESYKPDYILFEDEKPILVIDAKAPNEKIDDYIYQVSGYSLALNQKFKNENPVKYFILSNGITTKVYNWTEEEPLLILQFEEFKTKNKNYGKLLDICSKENIGTKTEYADKTFKFQVLDKDELNGVFKACHNLIWKKEGIDPTEAFYEFTKLFFIKLKQDKEIHKEIIDKDKKYSKEDFYFSTHWIDSQTLLDNPVNDVLFVKLLKFLKEERENKGKKRIFEDNERIRLSSGTIREIAKLIQHIDFFNIEEDLNGRMFETFLNATVRGKSLGQFFTPRSVVKFMTELASIQIKKNRADYVLDGCCGSGGFLIDTMAKMIEELDKLNLTNIEKERLKEKLYSEHIYGFERTLKISRIARMNLWFHGDGSSNIYCINTLDKSFDYDKSLDDERKKEIEELKEKILGSGLKFDVILTNPPFSSKYEAKKDDEKKIIKEYDIAYKDLNKETNNLKSALKSNVLFIERYYDLLAPKGKLITVIDESVLNAEREKDYRDYIRKKFIIKAVISLPRNTFVNADTNVKTSILYLIKKEDESESQPDIFMAIANNVGHGDTGKPTPELNDLSNILREFKKFENE